MKNNIFLACASLLVCSAVVERASAADWPQFRGPGGAGIAEGTAPTTWSESKNVKWKLKLPGAGSSSPIVVGKRIFLTCFSGEGRGLKRHLVCVNRAEAKIAWTKTIDAAGPEDGYRGYLTEHGYASNTPVCDGKRVFAFFGKTGVIAFDLAGKQLWQVNVGKESSNRRWGSAASLLLYKDMVIVNASEESQSIRALKAETGKEVWKAEAGSLSLAYGTPTLVKAKGGRMELVIGVPSEVWSLNPDTGKLLWYATTSLTGNICPSIVANDGIVYVFGGYRSSGSHAIRTGGKGDVTKTHMVWSGRNSSYVATPLLYKGHLYWVSDRGQAFCIEAKTGKLVFRKRLEGLTGAQRPFYASPVLADGKLYVPSRRKGCFVFAAKPEFKQIARNELASDKTDFNATPAISNGELFLRSNQALYCIGAAKKDE